MSKFSVLLLTLFGLAVLVLLLWRSPPQELTDLINQNTKNIQYPETIIKNAISSEFNSEGKITHSLSADTIRHFNKKNKTTPSITIDKPVLTIYDKTQTTTNTKNNVIINLSANLAEADEKKDILNLIGDVIVIQTDDGQNISQLKTQQLTVHPTRRYAETTKPVIIEGQSGRLSAKGFKVYFDDKRIELLSNVKGQYAPN